MEDENFISECRKKCAEIMKETKKDPKGWFADFLELEEKGNFVRVWVTIGGPTVWWMFNKETKSGRLYYHYGSVKTFRKFGRKTYEQLMAFVY